MSKTRIVKGKITEIIEKDYNMYSESNIVDNAAEIISDKGVAKGESYGNPEKLSAGEITAKCMVQFRPHANWSGEYGFDWIRTGDTGQNGDKQWYRDIIGKYVDIIGSDGYVDYCNPSFSNLTSKYDLLLNEFKKYSVPWKNSGAFPYYYIIPYLSLLPEQSAVLNLKVEVLVEPESFELKFDEDYLDVKFKNPLSVTSGQREIQNALEIHCKKEFNSDQVIEIMAVNGEKSEPVGQLIIVKNGKEHRSEIKITLVKVIKDGEKVDISVDLKNLKKILKQSYVDLIIQRCTMVIPSNYDTGYEFLNRYDELFIYLDEKLRTSYNSNGDLNKGFFDDSFRLFYVTDICETKDCGAGHYLGGAQKIPKKPFTKNGKKVSIIIFNRKLTALKTSSKLLLDNTTSSHELLHAVGVHHIFDNESKYVFKEFKTDNIMDYYDSSTNIKAKQTYKWQWELLKKKIL